MIRFQSHFKSALLINLVLIVGGCSQQSEELIQPQLETVAISDHQWTGVAVSQEGRIFVNYPRWSDNVSFSVAELIDGKPKLFPNKDWNQWQIDQTPEGKFVCVQSVFIDDLNRLWVLDAGNPKFQGVIEGAPDSFKLT